MKKAMKLGSLMITAAMVFSLSACATKIQTTDIYVETAETMSHKASSSDGEAASEATTVPTEETTKETSVTTRDDHGGSYHYMKQMTTLGNGYVLCEESYYDEKGNKIRFRSSSSYTDVITTNDYVYDSRGNLLKETETQEYQGAVTQIEVCIFFYENNLLEKMDRTTTLYPSGEPYDELCRVTYYNYDDNGQMIKEDTYYKSGELFQAHVCTYDDKGNLLTEVDTDADGNIVGSTEYEYDSKGNVTKMTWLAFDSVSFNYVNYEYNSNGEKIKASGDLYTYEYEYLDGHLMRVKYYDADGNYSSTTAYAYDEYGRVIFADTDSISDGIADMKVTYEYEW